MPDDSKSSAWIAKDLCRRTPYTILRAAAVTRTFDFSLQNLNSPPPRCSVWPHSSLPVEVDLLRLFV
jgi:hypothetical protein